jgi:hypothetical protein
MNPLAHKRQQILQQMEQIQSMEHGSVRSETRPSKRHPKCDCGPYFKHQVWEDGRNLTRRVPADQAQHLAEAIENRVHFEKLADEFIEATVSMTRAQSSSGSKKNATTSRPPSKRKREG